MSADFHFIALGGVGQSALARILLCLGYSVQGSDIKESKYTKLVESLGAEVFIGHNKDNIKGKPKVVVSSAIKQDNPELIKAKELGLQILHRSDCLKLISQHFSCFIGFSGTHGKTTTSGLCSFALENLQKNPAYAIGGIIPKLETNANCYKNSKYLIAELDESDRTIVKYCPQKLVINNIQEDHLDNYKNLDDILETFKKLTYNLDDNSTLFLNIDDRGVLELSKRIKNKNIVTYSINKEAHYQARNIVYKDLTSEFDIYKQNVFLGKVKLIIPGVHNIYNALSVISVLDNLGFKFSDYSKSLSEFTGMKRRFQVIFDNEIKLIDDYAHHPKEIEATLDAIKNLNRRKVVIFQPHRYTRLKALWDEFLNCFNSIDELFVLDVYSAGDKKDESFNSETFAGAIQNKGIKAQYIKGSISEAAKQIALQLKKDDIVLTLGAGDITNIGGEINDLLST